MEIIQPRSGTGFTLFEGDELHVQDLEGCQVADLYCVNSSDTTEQFSSGRTIDHNEGIRVRSGSILYSSKSRPMLEILRDDVENHDMLLTPCSVETFRQMYKNLDDHPGCEGNLSVAFNSLGVRIETFPATLNIFMNVKILESGRVKILPPESEPGSSIVFLAHMDVKVGLTACSAPGSNGGHCTAIGFEIKRKEAL